MEMSKEAREVYRAYHRNRYANNPEAQKSASNKYWHSKACKMLGKNNVSDEEIKQVKNNYYKQYRNEHKEEIEKKMNEYWERKGNEI